MSFKPVDNVHHSSAVSSQSLLKKNEDPKYLLFLVSLGPSIFLELYMIWKLLSI